MTAKFLTRVEPSDNNKVDILSCQYASASAHPIAFNSLLRQEDISIKKAKEKFLIIKDFANKINAVSTILCGGPAAYPELQASSNYCIYEILYSDDAIDSIWKSSLQGKKMLIPNIEQRLDIISTEGLSFGYTKR